MRVTVERDGGGGGDSKKAPAGDGADGGERLLVRVTVPAGATARLHLPARMGGGVAAVAAPPSRLSSRLCLYPGLSWWQVARVVGRGCRRAGLRVRVRAGMRVVRVPVPG